MQYVSLPQDKDVIDFIADNPDKVKGRNIYIDQAMFDRLCSLTSKDKIVSKNGGTIIELSIVCSKTGILTTVTTEATIGHPRRIVEVIADDIEPIGEIDQSKEPLYVSNGKNHEISTIPPDDKQK